MAARGIIGSLMVLATLSSFTVDLVAPSLPAFATELAAGSVGFAHLVVSVATLASACAYLPVGALVDVLGCAPVLAAGMVVYLSSSFASAFVTSMRQLLPLRALQGVSASVAEVAAPAAVAALFPAADARRQAVGALIVARNTAFALAVVVGSITQSVAGWRGVLIVLGGIGCAAAAASAHVAQQLRGRTAGTGAGADAPDVDTGGSAVGGGACARITTTARIIATDRRLVAYVLADALPLSSYVSFNTGVSHVLLHHYELPTWAFGALMLGGPVGMLLGVWASAVVRRRYSVGARTMLRAGLGTGICAHALMFAGVRARERRAQWLSLVALNTLAQFGRSAVTSVVQARMVEAYPDAAASASAILFCTRYALISATVYVAGAVYDRSGVPVGSPNTLVLELLLLWVAALGSFEGGLALASCGERRLKATTVPPDDGPLMHARGDPAVAPAEGEAPPGKRMADGINGAITQLTGDDAATATAARGVGGAERYHRLRDADDDAGGPSDPLH